MPDKATSTTDVSFVIPVYRSESCLEALAEALTTAMAATTYRYEIVLVNDGSPDGSWAKIEELAPRYPAIRAINLRRNFGQDNAIMAGLHIARGRVSVIMDDDLQHDPKDAARLVAKVDAGFDVCYARYTEKRQSWWKNAGSWLNDQLANFVLQKPRHIYLSPYKAISGEVVKEILDYDGPYPYVDGLLFRVTHTITQVDVEHQVRYAGRGNFTLIKSVNTWLRLATNFSLAPLRIATHLGFGFSAAGLGLALFYALRRLLGGEPPLGWASTIVTVLVLGGVQLACIGLIGEYLGRSFIHLNRQPQFVVRGGIRIDHPEANLQ